MRFITTVHIFRPADQVFAFATTPSHWTRWHPACVRVGGASDHPLGVGEQVTEESCIDGRTATTVWTVLECHAPRHWAIAGVTTDGQRASVTYRLTATADGTTFEREFVLTHFPFGMPEQVLQVLAAGFKEESSETMRRVRSLLEGEESQAV